MTNDNKSYQTINNIIDAYIDTSDNQIVSKFQFITERFNNYTNDKHFSDIFPRYYDPYWGGYGSAIPENFINSSYSFSYKENGTIVEITPNDISYYSTDNMFIAQIGSKVDHYPFIMSKLVLDGF